MSCPKKLAIIAAVVLISAPLVQADTLWIGNGKSAIKVDGVKITSTTGDAVQYVTDSGMNTSKSLAQLSQINLDGETSFNAAEDAYATADYATAITNYQLVLQSSSAKDWEQARAAGRLLIASKAQNRFDAEVDAYIALLQKDPTQAEVNKPSEPQPNSQYLDSALTSISHAMDAANLNDSQKSALLGLQLKINRAKGDTAQVNATLQQLVALGGGSDADKAMLKVLAAQVSYDAGKYSDAFDTIDQNRALFTEPDQQIDALYILAEAKQKLGGDIPDPEALKDQALAYMRVVTFGNQQPDHNHVPESLYAAGQIEEKLKEPQAAMQLYRLVVNGRVYANSSAVPMAKLAIEKLSAGK